MQLHSPLRPRATSLYRLRQHALSSLSEPGRALAEAIAEASAWNHSEARAFLDHARALFFAFIQVLSASARMMSRALCSSARNSSSDLICSLAR